VKTKLSMIAVAIAVSACANVPSGSEMKLADESYCAKQYEGAKHNYRRVSGRDVWLEAEYAGDCMASKVYEFRGDGSDPGDSK
jgi:hypothetical protein